MAVHLLHTANGMVDCLGRPGSNRHSLPRHTLARAPIHGTRQKDPGPGHRPTKRSRIASTKTEIGADEHQLHSEVIT